VERYVTMTMTRKMEMATVAQQRAYAWGKAAACWQEVVAGDEPEEAFRMAHIWQNAGDTCDSLDLSRAERGLAAETAEEKKANAMP